MFFFFLKTHHLNMDEGFVCLYDSGSHDVRVHSFRSRSPEENWSQVRDQTKSPPAVRPGRGSYLQGTEMEFGAVCERCPRAALGTWNRVPSGGWTVSAPQVG